MTEDSGNFYRRGSAIGHFDIFVSEFFFFFSNVPQYVFDTYKSKFKSKIRYLHLKCVGFFKFTSCALSNHSLTNSCFLGFQMERKRQHEFGSISCYFLKKDNTFTSSRELRKRGPANEVEFPPPSQNS